MHRSMDASPYGYITNECMDGWMHGWMNGWMDGCMERRKFAKRLLEVTFDLMGWPKMGPECKLCTEMYYFLNTIVANKGDFGAQ